MGFLIREGARLVVRLPQEVDHHKTESIRIQVDQMIRKEPVTEVEFDFSRTMFMDSAGIGLLIGRSQMMEALGGKCLSHRACRIQRVWNCPALNSIFRWTRRKTDENEMTLL